MGFVGSKAFRIPARLESIPQAICQDVDVCLYQAVRVRACLCRSVCRLADLPFALLSDTPTLSLHCRSPGSPHPSLRAKTLGAIRLSDDQLAAQPSLLK